MFQDGGSMSQLNFDPNSNGMSVTKSLNLFGELRSMPGKDNDLYSNLQLPNNLYV